MLMWRSVMCALQKCVISRSAVACQVAIAEIEDKRDHYTKEFADSDEKLKHISDKLRKDADGSLPIPRNKMEQVHKRT